MQREYAEWLNFWWEKGGDFETPRVAFVGDSITCQYYDNGDLKGKLAAHGMLADKFAGSHCAADPIMASELEYIFGPANGYVYKTIHFNNGLHGGCNDTLYSIEEYVSGYKKCCEVIRKNQPQAKLILVTSTNMVRQNASQTVPDDEYNRFILERNEFVRQYAEEQGYALDDLYAATAWNEEYPHSDGVHFKGEVCPKLADIVLKSVLES